MNHSPKNDNPRELLAAVRKGDFAHPGEAQAIDIVLSSMDDALIQSTRLNDVVPESRNVLDVGCGLGGTAHYLKEKMGWSISGIDLDANAIAHARQAYDGISFLHGNILEANKLFPLQSFDMLYLFNVLYAFENKINVLKILSSMGKPGSLLMISDYAVKSPNLDDDLFDFAGRQIHPLNIATIEATLEQGSWSLLKSVDLNEQYLKWYSHFITQLGLHKEKLLSDFTERAYTKVEALFSEMLKKIKQGHLGGAIVFAVKKD